MMVLGLKPGAFIQDLKHTSIGKFVQLSHGTHIYVRNHNLENPLLLDEAEDVTIGDYCWLGANSVILPGVTIGPHTIVGAGAIVTHSFPEGWCVIAGNPAKKIKEIKKE